MGKGTPLSLACGSPSKVSVFILMQACAILRAESPLELTDGKCLLFYKHRVEEPAAAKFNDQDAV